MEVPFVDLQANFERHRSEIEETVLEVLEEAWFVGGDRVESFERRFAEYLGVDHVVGVGSGTDAIRLAIEASDITAGDEVITVGHTFVSSVDAIVHNGARPTFVDIDPETYTIDTSAIRDAVTDDTTAILPVHLYGRPVDLDTVMDVATEEGLLLIEDACQAHGATYDDRRVGSFGDLACFSFYPSKNLGAYGDAGAVATDSDDLARRIRRLREYGQTERYHYEEIGHNSRLDTLQAAVLDTKLDHIDTWNADRRTAAERYDELLADTPLVLPTPETAGHVFHLYVVRTRSSSERDDLREHLAAKGVGTGIHYPVPVHQQESYRSLGYGDVTLPATERAVGEILSLPMYPELEPAQQQYVADVIEAFYA